MASMITVRPADQMIYPETDGKPMAETEVHLRAMLDAIATLTEFFRTEPLIHVGGNLLLYYEEGNPSAVVAPDVFVVFGIDKALRRVYKLWEEQQPPTLVIELTSRSTRLEDLGTKRFLYASLGVQEYILFDPLAEYLHPALQGYRLEDGEYVRIEPDADGVLLSDALGLRLEREGSRLRWTNAITGEHLLGMDEEPAARRAAEEQARAAEEQARAEATARRAAEEQVRVAEEQARTEAAARRAAEAELAQLRAELARLRGVDPAVGG